MKFMKTKDNRCFIEIEGNQVELKVFYSHEKPVATVTGYVEGRDCLSLSRITKEDEWQDLEMKPVADRSQLKLTEAEKQRIAELEAEIAEIKEAAKARKPKKFEELSKEEQIEYLKAQLARLEG